MHHIQISGKADPLSELGLEVVENEVGVGFGHCPHVGNVMSHHRIGEGEGGRWTIREVTHHQAIWMRERRRISANG